MDSEKECVPSANFEKCAVVLLDVAGTTTSTTFVKETLFTFAVDQAPKYLKDHWDTDDTKQAVKLLQDGDKELTVDAAVEVIKKLTKDNSDNKGLKTLQGVIYKKGYGDGSLKAHVFSDVPKALESWSKERKVAIYSTGSIESQKLLFAHTSEGDLTAQISNYFDQDVGLKTEAASYTKIAEKLKVKAEEVLFISDSVEELKAAKKAGLSAVLVKREGNAELPEEASKEFTTISSFTELSFDCSNKRKNEDNVIEAPPTKIAKKEETDKQPAAAEAKAEVSEEKADSKAAENGKADAEPMEVDSTEPETKAAPAVEEKKTDAAPEITSNTDGKAASVPETMETEEAKEAATEKKTVEEPVTKKTDAEISKEPAKAEPSEKPAEKATKKTEEETKETETKTESEPVVAVEVASSSEKNGEAAAEVKAPEKPTKKDEAEKIEVAEEAVEVVKEKAQNGECAKDNTEAKAIKIEEAKAEPKKEESTKEEKAKPEEEKVEKAKTTAEPAKGSQKVEEKSTTETKSTEKAKPEEAVEAKKVTEPVEASTTEKAKEEDVVVKCAEEKTTEKPKEGAVIEKKSPEEATKKSEVVEEKSAEELKDTDKKSAPESNTTADVPEKDLTKGTKDSVEANGSETDKQNGNGSCEPDKKEEITNGDVNGQENVNNGKSTETDPETDIKIKKVVETNVGSPAVSVEV